MAGNNQFTTVINALQDKNEFSFRPKGNSMSPHIKSGQLVTVEKVNEESKIIKDDIVLCNVNGATYLHFVAAVNNVKDNVRYLISNAKGYSNGWCNHKDLFAKVVKVSN